MHNYLSNAPPSVRVWKGNKDQTIQALALMEMNYPTKSREWTRTMGLSLLRKSREMKKNNGTELNAKSRETNKYNGIEFTV